MASRAHKRRVIAEKLAMTIARLQAEIVDRRKHLEEAKKRALAATPKGSFASVPSWFAVWSRHAPPLARAVGQLDRAMKRLPTARDKAALATMLEREKEAQRERIAAANVGYMRRLDELAAAAPAVQARWDKERAQEAKRMKSLRKRIEKRTRKDGPEQPKWFQKPRKLPDPIQQPDLSEAAETEVMEAPRPGLLPGTYRVMEPRQAMRLVEKPAVPKVWTASYVGVRLIEAHKVLARTPGTIWPKSFSAAWPLFKVEASEELILNERRRPRYSPSKEAIDRMNEAISWPMQFLSNRHGAAADVNWWAADAAWEQLDFDSRNAPWTELQVIANGLNAAKEPVT